MVAYSFAPQFAEAVSTGVKRQTVRGPRKRHARPGESLQLYCAMRTRHCYKLVEADPVCIDVQPIRIVVSRQTEQLIKSIEIDGVALDDTTIDAFASADGFQAPVTEPWAWSRRLMGAFWLDRHGAGNFDGFLIRWEPRG